MTLKYIVYDLFGLNQKLSQAFHSSMQSEWWIKFFNIISESISYSYFKVHLVIIVVAAASIINFQKKYAKDSVCTEALSAFKFEQYLTVFILSALVGCGVAYLIKDAFDFFRPYCTPSFKMNKQVVSIVQHYEQSRCAISFPSGHSMYVCFIVFSFWKILNRCLKWIGVILIILTGLSRVALGMHYFMDVLAAYVIATLICAASYHVVMISPYSPIRNRIFSAVKRLFVDERKSK